jgi:hypothetical protein
MRRILALLAGAALFIGLTAAPAQAITGGHPDGTAHPYVGVVLTDDGALCSGSLLSPTVFLTAGHCTAYFTESGETVVYVSFDPQVTNTSTLLPASTWETHPDYVDADWPNTQDFGVVILDEPVYLDQYAVLPELGLLDEIIPEHGQTAQRFTDVGYGQTGVTTGGGPPRPAFPLERRVAVQRYAPGGEGGVGRGLTDLFLFLQNVPSTPHGSACGGDSGSPVFLGDTNQLVAVHTGGYRLGSTGAICGRLTSLNHRLDTAAALDWITAMLVKYPD